MKEKVIELIKDYIEKIQEDEILPYQGQMETIVQEREKESKIEVLEELLDEIISL